jgi:hypothetical protein
MLILSLQTVSCGPSNSNDDNEEINVPDNSQDETHISSKFTGMIAAFELVFSQLDSDLKKNSKLSLQKYDEHSSNVKAVKEDSGALISEIKVELLNTTDQLVIAKYLENYAAAVRYNEKATLYLEKNLFQ